VEKNEPSDNGDGGEMNVYAIFAVGGGAATGAWLRWRFGLRFNPVFPGLPLGTLAANLLGGYVMGLALFFFNQTVLLSPEVRLAVTTGFLGGLTTFSTFSGETVTLFLEKEYPWAALMILSHVAGSLMMTSLGILTMGLFFSKGG
jgi:CrcB protein